MKTFLIFLVFLAPAAITASCNYWSLAKCLYKGWRDFSKDDSVSTATLLERIEKRVKTCDFFNDCGEVVLNCSRAKGSERDEVEKSYKSEKASCPLIHRMYKDDFASCAIAMEKHYWNKVCNTRKYDLSDTNMYEAFAGCAGEYVKKECTDDQYRIFESAHDILITYLRQFLKRYD